MRNLIVFKSLKLYDNHMNLKNKQPSIGFIGLGAMGLGMAQSVRRAGYAPYVFDLRTDVAQAFSQEGGIACSSLAELGEHCDVVISVVVNAAQTESVLFGQDGCAASMKPGSVFIMCSTVDPNWSVALEARLAVLGILYIDAPISGGAAKAASGEMTMMTAGKPEAYAIAEPILNAMAAKVYKLGDSAGAGSKVKIINQLLAGVHIDASSADKAPHAREYSSFGPRMLSLVLVLQTWRLHQLGNGSRKDQPKQRPFQSGNHPWGTGR